MNTRPSAPGAVPVLTPCVKVCRLDDAGLCVGCRRSAEEIMRWRDMHEDERLHLMRDVLPARRAGGG